MQREQEPMKDDARVEDGVFRHARVLAASPSEVFDAFREPARLARWWGPDGFSSTFAVFEFRSGGSWLFTMHGPDGAHYPNESTFLEIVPDRTVRIRHLNLPHFDLTIALEPAGAATRVSWVGVFENRDFAANARSFLEQANEQNLDRLAREVGAARPDVRSRRS